jgi:hypothetical protein
MGYEVFCKCLKHALWLGEIPKINDQPSAEHENLEAEFAPNASPMVVP